MKDVLDTLKNAIEEGQAKDASKAVQAALEIAALFDVLDEQD